MPKGHPLSKEEADARKRVSRRKWREKDSLKEKGKEQQWREKEALRKERSYKVFALSQMFARLAQEGKAFVRWTVEQELELIATCENTCALCDEVKSDLILQQLNPDKPFSIENAIPVCLACRIEGCLKDFKTLPKRLGMYPAIKDLPEGYHRQFLASICISEDVHVNVIARLRKRDYVAMIGFPLSLDEIKVDMRGLYSYAQSLTSLPEQVSRFGDNLFEVEARALFPEYENVPYKSTKEG